MIEIADPARLLGSGDADALATSTADLADLLASGGVRGEIRVRLVDDSIMSREHLAHKGDPETTDVLTFDLAPDNDELLDADVLVCADEARRQAGRLGHPIVSELLLYIVHAALHCTGYDDAHDEGPRGAKAMHEREDEILTQLGRGVVYHAPGAEDAS